MANCPKYTKLAHRILNTLNMLNGTDYIVVGLYFVLVFIIAFYSGSKKSENGEAAYYFLGGRNLGWFVIGSSLFASNIGSEHLVGLAALCPFAMDFNKIFHTS